MSRRPDGGGQGAAPALPAVPALTAAQDIRKQHPSTQTHIYIGQPGLARGDSDYFALYVANHVLGGGGLVSRLSEEIREKRGLVYSVGSPWRHAMSEALDATVLAAARHNEVLRVSLHPVDATCSRALAHWQAVIKRALRERTPVTKAQWASAGNRSRAAMAP